MPSSKYISWFVFLGVLLSRIPWVSGVSLGRDRDAWSTGLVAEKMADTFVYEASRLPGYPFVEIASAVFAGSSIWLYNLLTAIMSALCAAFFYLLLKQLHAQSPLLLTSAFAFSVTVYIESLELMDYMWALTFILASFYYSKKQKHCLSGLCLGLAVACRITSGAMLLPLLILSYEDLRANKRNIIMFIIGGVIPVVLFFLPVFYTYGLSFFGYYGDNSQLSLRLVLRSITVKLWGYPGTIGLIIAFIYALIFRKKLYDNQTILICLLVIAIYTLAFIKLPHETAYLLPIVPFVLIMMDRVVTHKRVLYITCVLIAVSSFVNITPAGAFSPVHDDYMTKRKKVELSEKIMGHFRTMAGHNDFVLIAKHYSPMFMYLYNEMYDTNTYHDISCQELDSLRQKNIQIFVVDPNFVDDCGVEIFDLSAYQ